MRMAAQKIIYGTAWKKERTTALVVSAVLNGFRAIDTALSPYDLCIWVKSEDLVGDALKTLQEKHGIKREDLFIQTKYTPIGGQDRSKPLPYDPLSRIETQINSSFQKSLSNLHTTYLDSLLLHSPMDTLSRTITAWRTLMSLQDSGQVKFIGVSNTYDVSVLEALERDGGRRVQIVQNRWFEGNRWDKEVFQYCKDNDIQYQSFWTLSGSPSLLAHPKLVATARKNGCTPAQALFKLAQSRGVTPLSGTTDEKHMVEDVAVDSLDLETEDLEEVVAWMGIN
ncbi:hypothetical protein NLI96_g2335 [Meripilus lineatus]|uniref:NADP-dependent oxidoreductase domain-containing protein n=1 Tax=Meripilus lineatus TaxID=2056292 RepID=A0AAD5VEA9_9APHY|nr:hypothetical protein NLI96_g2335 [Physisporinus lineatus]